MLKWIILMWGLNTRGWVLKVYYSSIQYNIIMVSGEYINLKLMILMWGLNAGKILEEEYWRYIIIISNIIQ